MKLRDDQILWPTRVAAGLVVVVLATASWVLYFHPDQTARRFAWTIKPTMTAMLMGAGYGSAIYFYVQVVTGRRWHRVALGFLPTTAFTWMLAVATILHWSKFHHGHLAFELWLWIYAITPFLVPALWLLNRTRDPGTPEERDAIIPRAIRTGFLVVGIVLVGLALAMFVWPSKAIRVWPWMLTPLTARAVAGFVVLPAVSWLVIATDPRWSAARATLQTVSLGIVLLLVAVARAWSEFDRTNPLTWLYVAGLAGTLGAAVALSVWMRQRVGASTEPAPEPMSQASPSPG